MSDLFWCTHCDNAISHSSKSLYCSEQCLRADALRNHPLLGYTYPEFVDFPRPYSKRTIYSVESLSTAAATPPPPPPPPPPSSSSNNDSSNSSRHSSASIHTVPALSTNHSSCQSSPTLSAFSFAGTTTPPPLLHLPPALSSTSSTPGKHAMPSFLLMGVSNATTALSRPSILDYRPPSH